MIHWPFDPKNKKYEKWYNDLILKSKNRTLIGYIEKHHIIPRSFGGSNNKDNIAILTAREHYIAHLILWKMKFPDPYNGKMALAFKTFFDKTFTSSRTVHHNYNLSNNKIYEKVKIDSAKYQSENFSGENATWYGRKHTAESKKLIGEKSKLKVFKSGPDHPSWGKKMPLETVKKISAINKEKWNDREWRVKQIERLKESANRPATKEKLSKRNKEKWDAMDADTRQAALNKSLLKVIDYRRGKTWEEIYSPEQIERIRNSIVNRTLTDDAKNRIQAGREKGCRAAMPEHVKKQVSERFKGRTDSIGEKNGMYGKKHSEESIAKIKQALQNRPIIECPHCGKQSKAKSQMVKWHFENCKEKR